MADKLHRLGQWYTFELPKKLPKKKKPTRMGTAYVARRVDGAYLLETRPESGLLGVCRHGPRQIGQKQRLMKMPQSMQNGKPTRARCATPLPTFI